MTNKELYEDFMKYEEHPFRVLLEDVKDKYIDIRNSTKLPNERTLYKGVEYTEVYSGSVTFEGDEVWQYGGYQAHVVEIPLKYFIADDIDTELENFRQERLQLAEEHNQRVLRVLKNELDEREKRRQQYEKLKQEFEDGE